MPEPTKPAGNGDNNTNGDGDGSNPQKTKPTEPKAFDSKTLSDEDFTKVFDDPRLFSHNRFKKLNEKAKRADELEKQMSEQEEAKLKEQNKWKELAEKKDEEVKNLRTSQQKLVVDQKIITAATKNGALDSEAVLALINRGDIQVDKDGNVTGVEEAVKALLDSKPYLKGAGNNAVVGSGTNPSGNASNAPKKFKMSELQDPKFWKENEAEILEAMKNNQVEMDIAT